MSTIFFNEKLNQLFCKEGFVVCDFVSSEILLELQHFYQNHTPKKVEGFHTTHFSKESIYKKKVNDGIIDIIKPVIEEYLNNYVAIFANFMIKSGEGNNPMPLHADWTYVDEPQKSSLAMWIPLVDISKKNGCLGVIPFSQHLSHHIRGPRIIQSHPEFEKKLINKTGRLLPIKAGQAIIYDHRLLHYSTANKSNKIRPAINISIVPKETDIIHYTYPEGKEYIHKYIVKDPDFFIYYNNFQVPQTSTADKYIDVSHVPPIDMNVDSFIKKFQPNLLNRIKEMIGV